ncbi:MAG: nucleotidyltransferase domain-containing protein [Oscillospiraceae bacterium]
MKQEEMNVLVPEKLKEIEKEYDVKVLLAVESGSRAWGFASPDSDFDVRFIYKRNIKEYLKLNPDRDVIELPIDDTWDICGWDIDKTLKLLQKSNPTLYEWVNSPIQYCCTGFAERIAPLMKECFSEEKMLYHYLNTARNNIKAYLLGETVKPKKYFYALRPIFACMWIMENHSAPPVLFSTLSEAVMPEEIKTSVDYLLDVKMNNPEKAEIKPIADISGFIDSKVDEIDGFLSNVKNIHGSEWEKLNEFFRNEINL